ncbi:MAG: CRISPR-associated ring nuclease [Anaerolineales bacterium]
MLYIQQSSTLIATLGTEPQVVTAALDLLLAKGENINQVQVVHTVSAENSPIGRSLQILTKAFEEDYQAKSIRLECHPLLDEHGIPFADVETELANRSAFRLLYQLVREAKIAGKRVHLSIAGGRKTMAVFGMATAQLLFDENDYLWHLYSSGDFLKSRRLHPQQQDEVHLLSIPLVLWTNISPVLLDIVEVEDPFEAFERQRTTSLQREIQKGKTFVEQKLTPFEREVVRFLVQETWSDEEIAQHLHKSRRTVEQQLRCAYRKAKDFYELEEVNRAHLISLLKGYYMFSSESQAEHPT